jgi:hypothetical protein
VRPAIGVGFQAHDQDFTVIEGEPKLSTIGRKAGIDDAAPTQSSKGRRDSAEIGKRYRDHAREYAPMQGEVK